MEAPAGRVRGRPRTVVPLAISLLGPALLAAAVLIAPQPAAAAQTGVDDARALALLERAEQAATTLRYRGTQFVSAWTSDGTKTAIIEVDHVPGGSGAASLSMPQTPLVSREYDLSLTGSGMVAGRPADIIEASRADGAIAARWWLDRETGLLLRQEMYDRSGALIRAGAFLSISVLTPGEPATAPQQPWLDLRDSTLGFATLRGVVARDGRRASLEGAPNQADLVDRLREEGWVCPELQAAGLELQTARRLPASGALQLSYTDGVSSVSVFEQQGRLDVSALEGYAARPMRGGVIYSMPGPPARLVWESDGRVYTLVADAPSDVVAEVVRRLPAPDRAEGESFLERVRRGLARVATWFNPFA